MSLDSILQSQKREVKALTDQENNTESDNRFLREEVKENMKQNKLLDVAVQKTERQKDSLKEFLRRNGQFDEGRQKNTAVS